METLDANSLLERSPQYFFKNALELAKKTQIPEALQSMDAAIIFSHHSPFYIYQKIRLLYDIGASQSCSEFIISQLSYLYKHASLYILCRCLDFLQRINTYSLNDFRRLLDMQHVPYCLADIHNQLLTSKDRPFFDLAEKALAQDDYSLCLCYCDLYLKLHTTNAKLTYMQAYSYHMLGHLMSARNCYTDYLKLHPNHVHALINQAFVLMELGQYEDSIGHFKKAMALEEDNVTYELYLSECYYVAKKYNDAIEICESLFKRDPTNFQNRFNLSHMYKRLSKNWLSKRHLVYIKKTIKKEQRAQIKKQK